MSSRKKKELDIQEESSEEEIVRSTLQSVRTSNWMLAIGVGAVVAIGTAAIVYKVRSDRRKLAYQTYSPHDDFRDYTVENYQSTFNKYWGLTKQTFSAVRGVVAGFFVRTATDDVPLFETTSIYNSELFSESTDNELLVEDDEEVRL